MRLLFLSILICAATLSYSADIVIPELKDRVNDYASIISETEEGYLENILKQNEDSTSNQVVILTVSSLQGFPIEMYSIVVVEDWKLGTKEKDNGVLILIAPNERKMRIEVGDGLQGILTDALSKRIIENEFIPYFKRDNYEAGISVGTQIVLDAIKGEYVAEENENIILGEFNWLGKLLIGGFFGTIITGFLLLFAIPAIVSKSVVGKIFTVIWYGIFCFALSIAVHC
jgi:uncharacterized protein